jgi:hypothetical protein
MNMGEVRRWVERSRVVPDDAEVLGTLPEFPVDWARGNPEYTNKLLALQARWEPDDD